MVLPHYHVVYQGVALKSYSSTVVSQTGIPAAELYFLCPLPIPSETVFLYLTQPGTKNNHNLGTFELDSKPK